MSAEIDFSSLPRQHVPRFVISPRRVLADVLSKGWVESTIPFLAFVFVIIGILLTTDDYFGANNLRNLATYANDRGLLVLALLVVVAVAHRPFHRSNFARSAFAAPIASTYWACRLRRLCPSVMTAHWGAANGAIAGLLGCGALLTTLGTMITCAAFSRWPRRRSWWRSPPAPGRRLGLDRLRAVLPLPIGFWPC